MDLYVHDARKIVFKLVELASPWTEIIVMKHHKEKRLFLTFWISLRPKSINR